jgi:hypothetical protein
LDSSGLCKRKTCTSLQSTTRYCNIDALLIALG